MIKFRIFGVNIRIDFMFTALVTIFLLVDKSGMSVIALLACIIHELGHVAMFFFVGYRPTELAFELTGIRLTKPTVSLNYTKEVMVQLAGSGVNFLVFALLCSTTTSITTTSIFAVTHLIIGIFNLLPLKSFDGGKLLEITMFKLMSVKATQIVCTFVDLACITVMLFLSIYAFLIGNQNFTFVVITFYLMITALARLRAR